MGSRFSAPCRCCCTHCAEDQKEEATDEVRGSREVETESITDWSVVDLRSVDDVDEKRTVERVQWRRTPAQTFAQIFSPPATE